MKKKFIILFSAAFVFRFILAFVVWHPDVWNHMDWGIRFWEYGPQEFYKANVWSFTWPNQPPGTIYMFAIIRKLFEFIFSVFWWFNIKILLFPSGIVTYFESNLYPALLQLPAILADLGISVLIYKTILMSNIKNRKKVAFTGALMFLVNPAVWYNSSFWGQYDSVILFFAFLSMYALLKKKIVWATLLFAISIYIKASLLVFVPIYVIFAIRQKYSFIDYIKAIFMSLLFVGIFTYPFSNSEPFSWLIDLYQTKVFTNQLQVITANAFNIWAGIAGIHEQPHTLMLGPLSYKYWGILLFILSYLPAAILVFKRQNLRSLLWSLTIVAFATFALLTNMHERYIYPLFPFITVLVSLDFVGVTTYWIISTLSLFNLYHFWWTPRIEAIVKVFGYGDRFLPRVLGVVNFALFILLYKRMLRQVKSS